MWYLWKHQSRGTERNTDPGTHQAPVQDEDRQAAKRRNQHQHRKTNRNQVIPRPKTQAGSSSAWPEHQKQLINCKETEPFPKILHLMIEFEEKNISWQCTGYVHVYIDVIKHSQR